MSLALTILGTQFNFVISCLLCNLVLSIAAQSPPLERLAQDVETIQQVTMDILEPWAQPRTSIKSAYDIASVVAAKQRFKA